MKLGFVVFAVACVLTSVVSAQGTGAYEYARNLHYSGGLRHARNFGSAEVIYRSSGTATQADAMRWWMNSPSHRRLVQSGQIQDIQCYGNVCVGRGGGSSYTRTTTTNTSTVRTVSNNRRFRVFRR